MIWFKIGVFGFLARWWIDIALAIHFYEAILATLAIVVWHFYQVIFDPDVYPMNWAWYDGKMSVETYAHEHAEDQQTIRAAITESAAAEEKSEEHEEAVPAGLQN